MSTKRRITTLSLHRPLLAALLLALPLAAAAQSVPAASSSTAPVAMDAMPGMDRAGMHHTPMPVSASSTAEPAAKAPVKKAKKLHAPAAPSAVPDPAPRRASSRSARVPGMRSPSIAGAVGRSSARPRESRRSF